MALKQAQIKIDPYTSTVPLVQMSPQALQATRPGEPLQGQFGRPGTGELAIGDAIMRGILAGHQMKMQRKYETAEATIKAADAAQQSAYQNYQQALSDANGNVNDPKAKAAYQAYLGVFDEAKKAKAQFMIQPKQKEQRGEKKKNELGFNSIKDFFEANAHIVPQIALMSMQPKPEGFTPESKVQNLEEQAYAQNIKGAKTREEEEQQRLAAEKQATQLATDERSVEAAGGAEHVMNDAKADPKLRQTARMMYFSNLDKMSPPQRMKYDLEKSIYGTIEGGAGGGQPDMTAIEKLTPTQRIMAGDMGLLPKVVTKTVTGKNGNKYEMQIDPITEKPLPGSEPLDLGPPAWEESFYARRALEKSDIENDIRRNPQDYGLKLSGNPRVDDPTIVATADHMMALHEAGIRSLAKSLGRTGYEVQNDNYWIGQANKQIKSDFVKGMPHTFTWTNGQKVTVTPAQMNQIFHEFVTTPDESPGVFAFRNTPLIPQGKDPQAVERDRLWFHQMFKNMMVNAHGEYAMTPEEADQALSTTALGKPIAPPQPMQAPPPKSSSQAMAKPPSAPPTKTYFVPGMDEPVELTDEDVKKAKAAGVNLVDADPILHELNQR